MPISRYEINRTGVPWYERVGEVAILNWRANMDVPNSPHTLVKLYTDGGLISLLKGQ